jgi:hypothetical protein
MMASLDADFEKLAEKALTPDGDETRELGERMLELAEDNWRAYATANDYDLDHIWRGARITEASDGRVRVEWPFSALWEFGVDPHVIEASDADYLSFAWPAPPEGTRPEGAPEHVRTDSVDWGSVTGGIPKARAVRDMLREFRGELQR